MLYIKIGVLLLIGTALISCGPNRLQQNKGKTAQSDKHSQVRSSGKTGPSPLTHEEIVKIGSDGGAGKTGGHFYDVAKPIDQKSPTMPEKKKGALADGIYRLRRTLVEGAEKTIRSAEGKKYNKILDRQLDRKEKFGVLHVSNQGQDVLEWHFNDEKDMRQKDFQSDGQGTLSSNEEHPCQRIYSLEYTLWDSEKGAIAIYEYCRADPGDDFAKAGLNDHHELWTFIYEPYKN